MKSEPENSGAQRGRHGWQRIVLPVVIPNCFRPAIFGILLDDTRDPTLDRNVFCSGRSRRHAQSMSTTGVDPKRSFDEKQTPRRIEPSSRTDQPAGGCNFICTVLVYLLVCIRKEGNRNERFSE